MKKYMKMLGAVLVIASISISSCKKTEYSFGEIKTPSGLTLATEVIGATTANPGGTGSGLVTLNVSSANAITYKVDFGDGTVLLSPSGVINYKYGIPGTFDYTITASAIGTGGVTSVISKKVKVYVAFETPANIVSGLTGGTSKVWVTDKEALGHVGVAVDPTLFFSKDYSATPNSRLPELYDDEITFTVDANNNISMTVDNKGATSMTAGSTAFYGFSGPDGAYPLDPGGTKKLIFSNATSGSTADVSTQIQFYVPGNGIVNFGTGGNTYEILSITDTEMTLRNIGADGLAWFQKLKVK